MQRAIRHLQISQNALEKQRLDRILGSKQVYYRRCVNGELSDRNRCLLGSDDGKMVMFLEPRLIMDSICKPYWRQTSSSCNHYFSSINLQSIRRPLRPFLVKIKEVSLVVVRNAMGLIQPDWIKNSHLSFGSNLEYNPSMRLSRQSLYDWLDSLSSSMASTW